MGLMPVTDVRTDPRLVAELRNLLTTAADELRQATRQADTSGAARGCGSPPLADSLRELQQAVTAALDGLADRAAATVTRVEANYAAYDRNEQGIVDQAGRVGGQLQPAGRP